MIELKHIVPKLLISESVAIVGSSGRLVNCPVGQEIDSFDDVVRFNRAPTKGWEKFCGSKTTVRVANSHVFVGKPLQREGWIQRDTKFIKRIKKSNVVAYCGRQHWERRANCVHPTSKAFQIDPALNSVLKRKLDLKIKKQLTVGMIFIAICIDSGLVPHLYGFDVEQDRPRDHYWEKRGPASKFHTPSDEKKALQMLAKQGKIIIH